MRLSQGSSPRRLAGSTPRAVGAPALPAVVAAHVAVTVFLGIAGLAALSGDRRERERGDVPGWVLITLMTAGLVTVIWAAAGPQLEGLFTKAISSVTGPGAR